MNQYSFKCRTLVLLFTLFTMSAFATNKPKVWIFTDMSDKTIPGSNHVGTINDPDDHSAMAGYLLMANMFETTGIVVTSTNREAHAHTPNQGEWANNYWKPVYEREVKNLNRAIGGYPETVRFMQSCIKHSAERFDNSKDYESLENYDSTLALFKEVDSQDDTINVLCWGTLTESAIFVKHCLATDRADVLSKVRFIAHWTSSSWHMGTKKHPETVPNCAEDAEACAYLKLMAREKNIEYYECGAIGQFGIVECSPQGDDYYDQFKVSELGTLFAEGKYRRGRPDHSDSATFWVLLGKWGVGLKDISKHGKNKPKTEHANELKFKKWSERIHNELLLRAQAAAPVYSKK